MNLSLKNSEVNCQMSKVRCPRSGFTLVELIIYIAIFSIASISFTGIMISALRVQKTEVESNEVTAQLNLVLDAIQREVKNSSLIEEVYEGTTRGTTCVQFCSVRLWHRDSTTLPTILRADAVAVYIKKGAGAESAITTDRVKVNNLIFSKAENPGGKAILQIDASFSYNSPSATARVLRSAVGRATAATFDSDILPNGPTLDIGNSANKWRDAFFSGNVNFPGTGIWTSTGRLGVGTASPDTSSAIEISGTAGAISINETSSTPAAPADGTEARIYVKNNKLIVQWNESGTVRYKYMELTGSTTPAVWVNTTTAP